MRSTVADIPWWKSTSRISELFDLKKSAAPTDPPVWTSDGVPYGERLKQSKKLEGTCEAASMTVIP